MSSQPSDTSASAAAADGALVLADDHCIEHLDICLADRGLLAVPDDIFCHPYLHFLDLSNNVLTELPPAITLLTSLVQLNVNKNLLTSLPKDIGKLKHLARLDANNNQLASLPASIVECESLETLSLGGNGLVKFPEIVADMPQLRRLYLGGNRIQTLPEAIARMTSLEVLYLGGNSLAEITPALGQLVNLNVLYLGDNQIRTLPESLDNLRSLRTLNLHNNHFRLLPRQILDLVSLEQLSLRGNPLVSDFIHEMSKEPITLVELCARFIKRNNVPYDANELPPNVTAYLNSAKRCTNPTCEGVYFKSHATSVEFVDFCGKYRVPLLKYLCNRCPNGSDADEPSEATVKKVLLTGYVETPMA